MTLSITREYPLNPHVTSFIEGRPVDARASGFDIDVINPTNERLISRLREADADEVDAAVRSARRAFDSTGTSSASRTCVRSPGARGETTQIRELRASPCE